MRTLPSLDPEPSIHTLPSRPPGGRRRAAGLAAASLLVLIGVIPPEASAQAAADAEAADARTGAITLRVVDSWNGEPIPGVVIRMDGAPLRTTDEDGRVHLSGLREGPVVFTAGHLGYGTTTHVARVPPSGTFVMELALAPRALLLDVIEVRAEARPRYSPNMIGFHRRMRRSSGTFITREMLEQRDGTPLTRVIAAEDPGFRLTCERGLDCGLRSGRLGPLDVTGVPGVRSGCSVQYFLDSRPVEFRDLDTFLATTDLEAIEAYSGLARVPPEFYRGHISRCGVILLWSREGRPGS